MAGPLLHVQEMTSPPTIGVPVVLVKKAGEGAVPEMKDKHHAQEQMPHHLHLTYLIPHTFHALHAVFRQVSRPMSGLLKLVNTSQLSCSGLVLDLTN